MTWRRFVNQFKRKFETSKKRFLNVQTPKMENINLKEFTDMVEKNTEKVVKETNKYVDDFQKKNPQIGRFPIQLFSQIQLHENKG